MAKEEKEKKTDVHKVFKSLEKKYGDKIFKSGEQLVSTQLDIIGVSPFVNVGIGGGISEGSVVLLSGDPKCGKTVTSLMIAKNAQKQGRTVVLLNIETRLKKRDLLGIKGLDLDPEKLIVVGSFREEDEEGNAEGKIITAEEYLAIAEHYIHECPGCIIIFDSISQLVTEDELSSEISKQHRAPAAVLMARFTKRMSPVISVNKCIMVGIIHMVANTSGIGRKTKTRSGGRKVQYAVDVDLECTYTESWNVGTKENPNVIGQIVHWKTLSTSSNVPPNRKFKSYLRYGIGLDEAYEMLQLAVDFGLVDRNGSWYTFSLEAIGEEEWSDDVVKRYKTQGAEKAYVFLMERQNIYDLLEKEVMDVIKF
jgi:recombination protein RecA